MLACNVLITVIVMINTIQFRRKNKKANRGEKILEGVLILGIPYRVLIRYSVYSSY